jgi:thioredoxin-dependent peroxiredoxin
MDAGIDPEGDRVTSEQRVALEPGQPAPDFEARDGDGTSWRLSDLRGRAVVLYFYPTDDTPGCTAEACDFRDAHDSFVNENYVVLGVSPQGAASHQRFAAKHRLNFPLLVDADLSIAQRYGAVREKPSDKGAGVGIERSTFVIDIAGVITHALYGVQGRGHFTQLRDLLDV